MIAQEVEPLNTPAQSQQDDPRLYLRVLLNELAYQLANVTVAKIKSDISVGNLDEVSTALHNEISKLTKSLTKQIQSLEDAVSKPDPEDKEEKQFRKDLIGKITDKVEVKNFPEIKIPEEVTVKNLEVLKPLFADLRDSLANTIRSSLVVNVPEAQVTVNPPQVNVPAPSVIMPEINLDSVVQAIESNLNKIRTNDAQRPLAVRLTDGQNWIKKLDALIETSKLGFAGFSDITYLKRSDGLRINPATEEGQNRGTLVPYEYDYIELSYTGSNPTGITYKKGGAAGETVATLTLAFSGSDLTSVTRA